MAVFPVRKFGDPVLRQKAVGVASTDDSLSKLVRDLFDTMEMASGVGLAAPQIGVAKRAFVWREESQQGALVNPEIVDARGRIEGDEGCLSIPGLFYPVWRSEWVMIRGLDRTGTEVELEAEGFLARIFQHEIDHLDGVLFIDRLDPDLQREAKRALREQTFSPTSPKAAAL